MTQVKKISKGDKFICVRNGLEATVISLTTEPGKLIGLQFTQNVNGHSCDNRGPHGFCLWASQSDILTRQEFEASLKVKEEAAALVYEELDSITLE